MRSARECLFVCVSGDSKMYFPRRKNAPTRERALHPTRDHCCFVPRGTGSGEGIPRGIIIDSYHEVPVAEGSLPREISAAVCHEVRVAGESLCQQGIAIACVSLCVLN